MRLFMSLAIDETGVQGPGMPWGYGIRAWILMTIRELVILQYLRRQKSTYVGAMFYSNRYLRVRSSYSARFKLRSG